MVLQPGREAAAPKLAKHMRGLRVLDIPASAAPSEIRGTRFYSDLRVRALRDTTQSLDLSCT